MNNFDCDMGYYESESIERVLFKNIGRVVTIYTRTGGDAGSGFTGLVTKVSEASVRLVTSIPSAPYERFSRYRRYNDCNYNLCEHCNNSHFGSAIVIPTNSITAISVIEI